MSILRKHTWHSSNIEGSSPQITHHRTHHSYHPLGPFSHFELFCPLFTFTKEFFSSLTIKPLSSFRNPWRSIPDSNASYVQHRVQHTLLTHLLCDDGHARSPNPYWWAEAEWWQSVVRRVRRETETGDSKKSRHTVCGDHNWFIKTRLTGKITLNWTTHIIHVCEKLVCVCVLASMCVKHCVDD